MSEPFLGEIKAVGWSFAARGYALCNGQILSIAQNTALFSLLGTTYGGNGQTTFNLPNLQGRVPMHQGQSPGTSLYQIGQTAGAEATTLGINQMPMHSHVAQTTVTPTTTPITATTTINAIHRPPARQSAPTGGVLTGGLDAVNNNTVDIFAPPGTGSPVTLDASAATTAISGGTVTASAATTVGNAGNSQPFALLQPYLVVNYIIALQGIFPSRN